MNEDDQKETPKEELKLKEEQEVKEENKFIVIPLKDLRYLDQPRQKHLNEVLKLLAEGRKLENKPENNYYVCNQDEPYAEDVLNLILKGEEMKKTKLTQGTLGL